MPDSKKPPASDVVFRTFNEIGIVLTALVGISIPVIVRHGDTSATANIANPKFRPATANEPPSVSFDLLRSGNASVYGDIVVDVVGKNASAKRVAVTSGIAVYSPNQVRKMTLALRPQEAIDFNKKTLSIKFKETGDQGKKVFAESELSVQ